MPYVGLFFAREEDKGSELIISRTPIGIDYELETIELYVDRGETELQWRLGTPEGFQEGNVTPNNYEQIAPSIWLGFFDSYKAAEAWGEVIFECFGGEVTENIEEDTTVPIVGTLAYA